MRKLAAETVQTILRYVVFVPILFDPEHVMAVPGERGLLSKLYGESTPWSDEAKYWATERDRYACMRVCRSWDAYLRRFEHRLIRLHDVFDCKYVPEEKIAKALVISLCTVYPRRNVASDHQIDSLVRSLEQLGVQAEMQILISNPGSISCEYLTRIVPFAPNLRAIFSPDGAQYPAMPIPRLLHLSLAPERDSMAISLSGLPSTLRSLNLVLCAYTPYQSSDAVPYFPNLTFLSIRARTGCLIESTLYGKIINDLGAMLMVLELPKFATMEIFRGVLSQCPLLEQLHYSGHLKEESFDLLPIGQRHPLTTLVVDLEAIDYRNPAAFSSRCAVRFETPSVQFHKSWPGWPRIKTVISSSSWEVLSHARPRYALFSWLNLWKDSTLHIEDCDGAPLSVLERMSEQWEEDKYENENWEDGDWNADGDFDAGEDWGGDKWQRDEDKRWYEDENWLEDENWGEEEA